MSSEGTQANIAATGDDQALTDALKPNPQRTDLSGMGFAALVSNIDFDATRREYAGTSSAAGDDPEAVPTVEEQNPVPAYVIPALDEIMAPLDRKGKRGALNAEERDYKHRRALLAEVLEQMVPSHAELAAQLAAAQQELAKSRQANRTLANEVEENLRLNEQLLAGNKSLTAQLTKARQTIETARGYYPMVHTATTQFCRLTGLELTRFHGIVQNWLQFKILNHPEFTITVQPSERKLRITLSGHETYFDLTDTGQLWPKDALAILALLGIKRDLSEALSAMAYVQLFGSTESEPVDTRDQRIAQTLGRVAVIGVVTRPYESGFYGFGRAQH